MRATVMYGAHDVRVENVPDARLMEPTDALVRVTRACICGSDLWPYNSMAPSAVGNRMGHEFIGVVESIGADVRTVKKGDLVVAPFAWSDGTCEFCQQGLQTSCLHGGWWGGTTLDGGQAKVTLPEGTQTGRQFRLRGKGMPVLRGGGMHGDLYIEIAVETPVKLCKRQKELLREFDQLNDEGCNPASESWLAKAKSFLNPAAKN